MSKKQAVTSPTAKPALIHQIDSVRRQHRIILMRDGRPDEGSWFDIHQIAIYKTFFASMIEKDGFPEGIFTVTRKAYEVLA
tara:strand:+ start:247 stop:489 length:243 start_codon:yes stop_codon:yes gene_type:complete